MGCGATLDGEPASHPIPATRDICIAVVIAIACRLEDSCWTSENLSLELVQLELVIGEVGGFLLLEGYTTQLKSLVF